MPQKSRWTVPVPAISLPTFVLGPPGSPLPDTLAYADAESPSTLCMTWPSFRLWSQRFAAGLSTAGLQVGDRVLTYIGNDVFFPVLHTGIVMAGGIYSSANSHSVARELAHQMQLVTPKFVLASQAGLRVALEAADQAGIDRTRIFVFDNAPLERVGGGEDVLVGGNTVRHWKALIASKEVGGRFVWEELSPQESKTRTAAVLFSSGTTGLPKGMELTHYNLIANAVQTDHVMSLDPNLRTKEQSAKNSRWLCAIPLYHGLALIYFMHIAAYRRVPTYIMKQFEINKMLSHVQQFHITELHVVPPIVVAFTKNPALREGKFDISSLTKALSCAAPLGAEVTVQFENLWPKGQMNMKQALAQSETGGNTLGWDSMLPALPGSVGEPWPNCEIMLVDDEGREVPKGERGEIWVKSPNCMKGYFNNPRATAETLSKDGWLMTGDVACQDEHGWYYVVDRKKELIKVKGVQVAPAELEAILLDHPGIQDAAVIGVTPKWGEEEEVPRAFVVADPGASLTEKDVTDYMNGKVSTIKQLAGGVVFVDSIPKAPSGKILRRVLRDRVSRESKL